VKVLRVSAQANNAQIAQSVVVFAPVAVVNQPIRPNTMRRDPRQTMSFVNFLFDAYCDVAKLVGIACNVANVNSLGGSRNPCKNSRVGVVAQQLAEIFRQKFISHACNPFWRFNVNARIIA
jgi:hypothetical protein